MNKNIITIVLFSFFTFLSFSQSPPPFKITESYEEPVDPVPTDSSTWEKVPNGLQATLCSTNERFVRGSIPSIKTQDTWRGEAWRGERISSQLVMWSKDPLTNVSVSMSLFNTDNGEQLPPSIARIRFEKYVITDEFAEGCGHRKPEDYASSLAADALDEVSSYMVRSKETRPVWISIDVPSDAKAGNYTSTLELKIQGQPSQKFTYELTVIPKTLPPATDWKFHLDLWQNPYAVARYHKVQPWSAAHWNYLKPLMSELANAGQKVITVSLNKRPWGGQTYDEFDAMVSWKKKKDGSWEYDYTIFDNWVQFMMDLGIENQISCYTMVPWGNEFYYFDEKQNKEIKVKAAPGTKEYAALWTPFLKQFKKHLETKGWNKITRIAMDERKPEEMKAMLKLLNEYAPEFGISFADNHKSYKLYPNELKDLSVGFAATIEDADLELRKSKGHISTHYVCCADPFPNVFTFSEPAEGIFIGWFSMAANYDGFLRWAYNSWVENPLQDSRFRAWPAGDTYIVYPEARSSIRFETLREGIQDAEKIRILREDFSAKNMTKELGRLNKLVKKFNIKEKPDNLDDLIRNGQKEINDLAKKLAD